jgi:3-deoxy-D-manno-octulosonic-acid transferase
MLGSMTFYDLAYTLALGVSSPVWVVVPKLRRKVLEAMRERKGTIHAALRGRPGILIHAVSMGEINATTSLVNLLSVAMPELRFIITTTSLTGQARAKELYENNPNVTRVRFPLDFSGRVARLLTAQRPKVAVLMELEVWPNFMIECGKRDIPVILVNGRLSAYSFRGYKFAGLLTRPMFRRLTLACVQEEAYARRFARVGVPEDRIHVTGTMKFDTAQGVERMEGADALGLSVGLRRRPEKIWVCGSTGPGEEQIVLTAFAELRKKFPTLRLVIVPRHPQRFDEVADLIRQRGFNVLRRSAVKTPSLEPADSHENLPIILGDTMGELRKFYNLADIVFVGRTLVDLGSKQHGSDMIEPAALAKPVIVGPFTGNFAEVMNRFREANAMREVSDGPQLQIAAEELLLAPIAAREMAERARDVVRKNLGATARHVEMILELLQATDTYRKIEAIDELDQFLPPN